jgi:ribonuclease HII
MPIVIGTDEAGYGPNLGPLVVAASVWRVPEGMPVDDLYGPLAHVVSAAGDPDRVQIADSKVVYKSGCGLAGLESVVLGLMQLLGQPVAEWHALWRALARLDRGDLSADHWHANWELALPAAAPPAEPARIAQRLSQGMASAEIELLALQARAVFPSRFNELVRHLGNKAALLSLTTLGLVAELLEEVPVGSRVTVTCDKHGGRDYYAALLQHVFPDTWVRVLREAAAESNYRFSYAGRRIEFRFVVQGERHLPTALASMTAKYLREMAMLPFNAFWQRHVPGLKPTAGYATDSRRFLADIADVCEQLGIDRQSFWRQV